MTGDGLKRLVLDENISPQLAEELNRRGIAVDTVKGLGLTGATDPDLLRALADQNQPTVLVTTDDRLPEVHADVVAESGATIATIDSRLAERGTDAWARNVVHKYAHRMQQQTDGEVRRYSVGGHRRWTPRLR